MPAAITDKFNKASNGTAPVATTLASQKAVGAASISLSASTGWPTDTAVHFKLYRIDAASAIVAGTETIWKGTLSGTTISNLTLQSGTDQIYAAGSVVEAMPTSAWADDFIGGILVEHNQDGTHAAVTADTLTADGVATFTSHIDVNDASTAIRDSSDNELVKFAKTASAVNEVTVRNASTGNAAEVQATGEANARLHLKGSGTGNVQIDEHNPYKFRARRTTAINSSAGNTILMPFNAEDFDTNNNFDVATNVGRYTAPVAGFYYFHAYANYAAATDILFLYKNGAVYRRGTQTGNGGLEASFFVQSAASDYWEIFFFGTNTVAVDVTDAAIQPLFEGFLVSRT